MSIDAMTVIQQAMQHDTQSVAIINHNIAHQNTHAFKAGFIAALGENEGRRGKTVMSKQSISFKQGPLVASNKSLDVAIIGRGFFTFKTSRGVLLSRDGRLHINAKGQLCNQHQDVLLSAGIPIVLAPEKIEIKKNGEVWQRASLVQKIELVDVVNPSQLKRVGNNYFQSATGQYVKANKSKLSQYHIETSNVDFVQTTAELMRVTRHYALLSRVMKVDDSLVGDVISQALE